MILNVTQFTSMVIYSDKSEKSHHLMKTITLGKEINICKQKKEAMLLAELVLNMLHASY